MANFCGSCGAGLVPNSKFCGGCGQQINMPKPVCLTCGQDLPQPGADSFAEVGEMNFQTGGNRSQLASAVAPRTDTQANLPNYGKNFVAGQHCGNCGFETQGPVCESCCTDNVEPLS